MSADQPLRTIPVKRRNGKLQSCEPCRKRKLSCDHRLPACGRCVRRSTANTCYYHPAPLTKQAESGLKSSPYPPSAPQHNAIRYIPEQLVAQCPVLRDEPPQSIEQRLHGILSVPSAGILMESIAPKVGYLGETSTSAVVAELNSSLGIHPSEDTSIPGNSCISETNARKGAQVLAFYLDMERVHEVISTRLDMGERFVMFRPLFRVWLEGITTFMQQVVQDRLPEKLERHSLTIWRNTQQPLQCGPTMSAIDWAMQATGKNLRWEILGLFLTMIGALAGSLPSWDSMFKSKDGNWERDRLMKRTMHLAKVCIDLSRKCGSQNDLLACLVYESLIVTAAVVGDTSSEVWTGLSDACDTIILSGLHLGSTSEQAVPFFLRELRIRLFNLVYSMDKFTSTFLGRPPKISHRYCVVRDPHDLKDEDICGDAERLQNALSKLEDGWSQSGPLCRATWRKAWSKRHTLREDVLEVVIGPHAIEIDAAINNIRTRERQALDAMPAFVRINPEELLSTIRQNPSCEIPGRGAPWRPYDVQCFLSIHSSMRHTEFLLERVRVNRFKADSSRLVAAAKSLLTLILKSYGLRDYLRDFQWDLIDLLALYGVPPAGVLAMELLKREQFQEQHDSFPRSEILQQLSVFVTVVEEAGPAKGNYSLCQMGANAIRRVLDTVLSKPRHQVQLDISAGAFNNGQFGANIRNDADFFQWLGSMDFETSSWLDPSPVAFSDLSEILHAASV